MACTNCFGGCVETTSDKCVKYTGNTIEFLGISNGDTLQSVQEAITNYLATVYSGEGILPVVDPNYICDVVADYLPVGDPTLIDVLTAVIRAICEIEAEVVVERARIGVIEANYTPGCLTSAANAGTHVILQEVITTLCTAIGDITTLENLFATCITTSTIDTYIQNYLATLSTDSYWYTKMVPYVIYPFYPNAVALGSFAGNGAGFGAWDKIYLCNGENGTPDLRGRSLIGVTNVVGGGTYETEVDPNTSGSHSYLMGDSYGQSSVALVSTEMAAHTHVATVAIDDPGHLTSVKLQAVDTSVETGTTLTYPVININDTPPAVISTITYTGNTSTTLDSTGLNGTNVTVTNANNNAGAAAHNNVHPVHACFYVMYLP